MSGLPNGGHSVVWRIPLYAVVRTGGKQYRVEEGRAVKVERLSGEVGDVVELGDVLLMDAGDGLAIGAPTVSGARVMGTIAEQGRSKKIIVFRYKAKTRYRKKTGHRQHFTKVLVDDILMPGQEPKPKQAAESKASAAAEPEKKGRRKKAEAAAPSDLGAESVVSKDPVIEAAPEVVAETTVEANETTEKPAKASRRKAE